MIAIKILMVQTIPKTIPKANNLHFRSSTLKSVTNGQKSCWQTVLKESITIPSEQVHIYGVDGDPIHNTPLPVSDTTGDEEHTPPQLNNSELPHALRNTPDTAGDTAYRGPKSNTDSDIRSRDK